MSATLPFHRKASGRLQKLAAGGKFLFQERVQYFVSLFLGFGRNKNLIVLHGLSIANTRQQVARSRF
jgi:hypothetical protein